MDSRFAVFFFITGMLDTYLNECPTECFKQAPAQERLSLQYGDTYFQEEKIGKETYLIYDLPRTYGAFQPTAGISVTNTNDVWFGMGGKWTTARITDSPIFIELSLMPGFYIDRGGPDLGFPTQFRGALGTGYTFDNGASVGVFFDHRSNANATALNPGIETLTLRFSMTLD